MKGIIKIKDSRYPDLLRQTGSPPPKLHYKGVWDRDIFKNCLAVVGSRRMTAYGRQVTHNLISEIASEGITIVSGFMYGIDASAHKAALYSGGRTIAVMPCGIDLIHPGHQVDLYNRILQNRGLIISEHEGDFEPALWTYPRRNRIVAGISQATLVVEAAEKSGSLITAGLTEEYKRRLFAVPGPITSPVSRGTVQLIKNGACAVSCPEDILTFYGITHRQRTIKGAVFLKLSNIQKRIIKVLRDEPLEIDILARRLGLSASKVSAELSLMQINNVVFEENGKYFFKDS